VKTVAIIPAFNEVTQISDVINGMKKHVDSVIVIDDGSTDGTGNISRDCGAIVVTHRMTRGAGAATMTGIIVARLMHAQAAITIDADGQHDPNDSPKLLAPILSEDADIVIGTRFKGRNNVPFLPKLFNKIGNILTFMTTGKYVSDSQSGFKAFGPVSLYTIHLHMDGFEFCTEIVREIAQYGWKAKEVPVGVTYSEYTRAKGQSFSRGVITACKILLRFFLR
jgi:glycosyltransferase involved in cell wall biosynthesis